MEFQETDHLPDSRFYLYIHVFSVGEQYTVATEPGVAARLASKRIACGCNIYIHAVHCGTLCVMETLYTECMRRQVFW